MPELEPGEQYLYIRLLGNIELRAFKNKNKKSDKEPDFKGDGIAIWLNKKQGPKDTSPTKTTEESIV